MQEVVVDAAGDEGGDGGVAVIAGPGGRAGQPGRYGRQGGAGRDHAAGGVPGAAQEVLEAEVELEADGLPGPVGQAAGGEQPQARLFQGVVVPLGPAAGVLRAGFPGQRVQHRLQRGGAPGSVRFFV